MAAGSVLAPATSTPRFFKTGVAETWNRDLKMRHNVPSSIQSFISNRIKIQCR